MGLDYLNKKIWHPGSMKNIQKVWQVEQQQREINKRTRQRAKKLLQQQHNDDLKRIQVQAGLIPRSHLDRMDWMYDWGNKIGQQKTNEQFLTGKKASKPGQFKAVYQQEITNRKCQDFQLLHEDPMYEIMKQEKIRKDAIMNNPMEMRNIIKQVERQYLPHDFQERKKKHLSSKRRRSTSSQSDSRRHKRHKKSSRRSSRSRSGSKSRSRSREKREKEQKSSKFKQSKLYRQYYSQKFGGIAKQDENGNLKPDYSTHRPKYKTQFQLDEQQRNKKLNQYRQNARQLNQARGVQNSPKRQSSSQHGNYQQGAARIRKNMMHGIKQNRNHKKYRHSDSD